MSHASTFSSRTSLLTGATGVIGCEIAGELLRSGHTVFALIRARDPRELEARKDRILDFLGIEGKARDAFVPLAGDVTRPLLGLEPLRHAWLARRVGHVVHAAANVKLNQPRGRAIAETVAATREVISLCRRAQAEGRFFKLEAVSTVGVGGRDTSLLAESFFSGPRRFHNAYEEAKAAAERALQAASAQGLPLTVHRPSMVVGHCRTGRVSSHQVFYHLADLVAGIRTRGWLPDLSGRTLDVVPVDAVARGVVLAMHDGQTRGRVLHLASGPELSLRLDAIAEIVRAAYRRRGVRVPRIRTLGDVTVGGSLRVLERVLPASLARRASALRPLLAYLRTDQAFAVEATHAWLAASGEVIPPPSDYLEIVLDSYLAQRRKDDDRVFYRAS